MNTKITDAAALCCAKVTASRPYRNLCDSAGKLMTARTGKALLTLPMAMALTMNTVPGVYAEDGAATANEILSTIMGVLGPGVVALGTLVTVVGGIQLGKGFTREDGESKSQGMMTIIGGIIIAAVGGIVSSISIELPTG